MSNRDQNGQQITLRERQRKVLALVLQMLGYPEPVENEDKYYVASFDPDSIPTTCVSADIQQVYLSNGDRIRERRASKNDPASYTWARKKPNPKGRGRIEIQRTISESEYFQFLASKDASRQVIYKKRYCFLHNDQYFEIDVFEKHLAGLVICEREKTNVSDKTVLPDFLKASVDVTDNPKFYNENLSLLTTWK